MKHHNNLIEITREIKSNGDWNWILEQQKLRSESAIVFFVTVCLVMLEVSSSILINLLFDSEQVLWKKVKD